MSNKDFGLLDGLFVNPATTSNIATPFLENTKEKETKRTWKIKDELWDDFTTLVAASGLTQAEFVNKLMSDAIEQNKDKIKKFRELR